VSDILVLESYEQSTMVSAWTEYLCLQRLENGNWYIDIRSYEVAGEVSEFEDEDGELPDEIDGEVVIGTEDGYVLVNNLEPHSEGYPFYEFTRFCAEEFCKAFEGENPEWSDREAINAARMGILNFASVQQSVGCSARTKSFPDCCPLGDQCRGGVSRSN